VEGTEVRTYRVLRANLDAAANALRQLAAGGSLSPSGQDRRVPVTISAEPVSRSLIVSGPGDVFPRVEEVLHQLDARQAGPATALRFFKLRNARAEALAPMVREILLRRVTEDVADAGADPGSLLNLSADRVSNTLVVSAPPPVLNVADSLVRELDQPLTASGAVDVRVFQLAQAAAPTVADAVRRALESRVQAEGDPAPFTVAPEPSSNTVVVTATPRRMEQTAKIIEELDGLPPAGAQQVRTVFLKHARAERVAPLVSELLGHEEVSGVEEIPYWARLPIIQAQMARNERQPAVRVAADARLNAVVVSAPSAILAIAEQMVIQLDIDPASVSGAAARRVRVLVVENADATELAASLGALFEPDAGEAPPVIRVDAGSNCLLVLGTEAQLARIEEVAGDVDRATVAASREMRLIPIDPARANAGDLARSLQQILGRSGRAVNVMTLEELLERRAPKEPAPDEQPRDGPQSALPSSGTTLGAAAAALAITAVDAEKKPGVFFEEALTIAADPATNSLVVVGTPRAIDRVADLAQQLAAQLPQAPDRVHYVALPPALDAQATAGLMSQALSQMTPPGGARGDLRRRVAVLADPANNAIVIACNDFDFEVAADLLAALTRPAATEQVVVKVYALQSITAERAAESVRRMLDPARSPRGGAGRQGQRLRDLAVKLLIEGQTLEAVFDPARVGVSVDAAGNALVVTGPPQAIGFVDQFIELLDQARPDVQATLKLYPLRNARARDLVDMLRNVFRVRVQGLQGPGGPAAMQPELAADERTNTILATAAPEQLAEIDRLLEQLDGKLIEDRGALRMIELSAAQPQEAARILDQVVIGSDQARRGSTLIVPNDSTGVLLVRASDTVMAEIDAVLKEIDRPPTSQFKVRSVVLERADAAAVADALQKLYDDRARIASTGRGRRAQSRQVSIIGDARSRTILVAAGDEDFEEIKALAAQFDSPQASQSLAYRVIQLKHARATEIQRTVQDLANDLLWGQEIFFWWGPQQQRQRRDQGTLAVRADARLNALIVTGAGDKFEIVEKLVEVLDAPQPEDEERVVRLYRLEHADVDIVAGVLLESYTDPNQARRWWEPASLTDLRVRSDARNKVIIVSGSAKQQEEIAALIATIDKQVAPGEQQVTVLAVEFAQAGELAQTLNSFLRDRARATGAAAPRAVIVASQSANTLIVSAGDEDTATIRDLVGRMDQPEVSGDRTIEILALTEGNAEEIARIVGQQFGRRGGTGVVATPDPRTNSLIVNAPRAQFAQARALIERLDAPSASDETVIRTYALKGARAEEVVRILGQTLQLDERGRTAGITIRPEGAAEAVEVRARIVADPRSNSVIVTATEASLPAIEALIAKVDDVPAASPVEYRIVTLEHALAVDVSYTLRQFLTRRGGDAEREPRIDYDRLANSLIIAATPDQFEQIQRIIAEIDRPASRERMTDFVPLRFAAAEQVQEALSVFYGPLAIEADTPGRVNTRIVADTASNSLVITADESEWANIRALLEKLDSEEYDASLQLRVIALTHADARSVARAINEAFVAEVPDRRAAPRPPTGGASGDERPQPQAPTALVQSQEWVRASAEPLTNSVIISASRQRMLRIEQIIAQLDVADYARLPPPGIIPVRSGNPAQLAEMLTRLFAQGAEETGGRAALRIIGDAASGSLIVRAGEEDMRQVRAFAEQLDGLNAAAGKGIFIIELEHVSPDAARGVVETIGLDKPPREDSSSRLVTEPIQVAPLAGRNALIVVANPADRDTIVGLFKAIDGAPPLAESHLRVIRLRNAKAEALEAILNEVLAPGEQQAATPLARAVQEQVRRLAVQQDAPGPGLRLDLTQPVRVIADAALNALVVSSTTANVEALAQIIAMFDQVPVTDAVTVQLFPLTNIAAEQFARIVRDLFRQGKELGGVPGTLVEGVPAGGVGRALLDEVALSVDERTNTVVVAGKADSLALVQVLYERLDHDVGGGWVEPRILPLRFADAEDLAETLHAVLVDGAGGVEASPLTRQVARMRMARLRTNGGRVLEADMFAPMTRLVIRAQPRVNALVLVGTPMNLEVVSELVQLLDVEAAAPGAAVRVYPLERASAARLAPVVTRLFEQQAQAGTLRPDDRVTVQPDERTNALIVSTSPTSFQVVEGLLALLDRDVAPELQAIQRVDLENASATRVAEMVQQLMDARLERLRRTEPESADLQRATVLADTRSNSLVVAAGPESLEVVKRLAADLDRSTMPEGGAVQVVSVSRANVDRIAETVNAIMERRYADMPEDVRAAQRPLVLTDPRSNSLLVAAGPDDLAVIRDLVAKLDATPLNPAVRLAVVPIEGSRAETLADRVQSLMRQRQQSLGPSALPSDDVTVEADVATNSLIVAATDENLQVVRDLVGALRRVESETAPGSVFEILQLESSRAGDVVNLLGDLYVDDANRRRGPETVRVTADERLNAVLVGAPADDLAAIRSLVAQLDGTRPSTVVEIRYVALSSANALETVSLIQNVLSGRGLGAQRTTRQATVLKYFREYAAKVGEDGGNGNPGGNGPTEMEVSAAIRESITLTPDLRTNTVIVSAPAGAVQMIERMIRDLDASSMGAQSVRIFKLGNADALAMAEILTDLFNLSRRGNLYVLKPRERPEGEMLPAGGAGPAPAPGAGAPAPMAELLGSELTAVPDDRQELSITVDSRTNSLLVSGTPQYLDLVGEVVEKLDALEANEREVFVYPLRNAAAAEVARVLTQFVEKEQEKLLGTLSPDQLGSAARLLEREVTIVGDDRSNTVLVSASPRYLHRVRQMVSELDVDPPQVLIQVLLAEVTLDSNLEWGFDTRFDLGPYGGDDLLLRGASSLASVFLPGLGIPSFSVSTDDFSLLLRALEAQGRIQVLSNPSVMAANNQPAHIQVGENIGRASSQSLSSGGTQQTLVEFLDIGVILDVTPSINPDGFVRMTIAPSITDLTNRNTQVSEDLSVPILTKRETTTTVTVRDGQTIVIGGLIQDTYEARKQKVPILGDIPLLGLLFRSEFEETSKIELLIVLTPHVIISPTQFARVDELTGREIGRMSLTPQERQGLKTGLLVPETVSWKERARQAGKEDVGPEPDPPLESPPPPPGEESPEPRP
jgi:type II secretion system protein D